MFSGNTDNISGMHKRSDSHFKATKIEAHSNEATGSRSLSKSQQK